MNESAAAVAMGNGRQMKDAGMMMEGELQRDALVR